jgi:large subunit ribosomal protein L23Ae
MSAKAPKKETPKTEKPKAAAKAEKPKAAAKAPKAAAEPKAAPKAPKAAAKAPKAAAKVEKPKSAIAKPKGEKPKAGAAKEKKKVTIAPQKGEKPQPKEAAKKTAAARVKGAKGKAAPKAAASKTVSAQKVSRVIKKGNIQHTARRVHHSVHFHRPHTLRLARNPKYPRRSAPGRNKMDQYRVLRYPLTTETAMKKIEDDNTLVFIVDLFSNKYQIKDAFKKLYDINTAHINTLVRPDGLKKAFIRLPADVEAMDVASKIGIV